MSKRVLRTNSDWRALKKAKLEERYAPPTPAWVADLGRARPLITRTFAEQARDQWERMGRPESDPCGVAMAALLDYAEHSPFVNVLVNWDPHVDFAVSKTVALVTRRDALLFAIDEGATIRIPSMFLQLDDDYEMAQLDDDNYGFHFTELVYPVEGSLDRLSLDIDVLDYDPVVEWLTIWTPAQCSAFADFQKTPASRRRV